MTQCSDGGSQKMSKQAKNYYSLQREREEILHLSTYLTPLIQIRNRTSIDVKFTEKISIHRIYIVTKLVTQIQKKTLISISVTHYLIHVIIDTNILYMKVYSMGNNKLRVNDDVHNNIYIYIYIYIYILEKMNVDTSKSGRFLCCG